MRAGYALTIFDAGLLDETYFRVREITHTRSAKNKRDARSAEQRTRANVTTLDSTLG
jgi:hypothetical protein